MRFFLSVSELQRRALARYEAAKVMQQIGSSIEYTTAGLYTFEG
jgi:hypothetical protein